MTLELSEAISALIYDDFRDRAESFDLRAADQYAEVVSGREHDGRPISTADAQIAAICRVLDAALATRNTSDFTGTGVSLINPWKAGNSAGPLIKGHSPALGHR